jgi:hypothetical protein
LANLKKQKETPGKINPEMRDQGSQYDMQANEDKHQPPTAEQPANSSPQKKKFFFPVP